VRQLTKSREVPLVGGGTSLPSGSRATIGSRIGFDTDD